MPKQNERKPFAKKSLGQNFLVDQIYIEKLISSLNPRGDQTIFEVGAGRGALTKQFVECFGKVIAIEIDSGLARGLREDFANHENFILIEKDVLEIDFQALAYLQSAPKKTKLAGNLPYYISTAILQHLIRYRYSFMEMVLMLQKEVVDRITAEPGNKERGFLTVLIEAYFETEKLFDVPARAFRPAPKVTSAVLRLLPKPMREFKEFDHELFRDLVSLAFGQKRKTIANNLKNAPGSLGELFEKNGGVKSVLGAAGIDTKLRAEVLSNGQWLSLLSELSSRDV